MIAGLNGKEMIRTYSKGGKMTGIVGLIGKTGLIGKGAIPGLKRKKKDFLIDGLIKDQTSSLLQDLSHDTR
jgi:hypothetical protein